MQKLALGILFMAAVAPGVANADMKWSGGAGTRHLIRRLDDGLNSTDAAGKDTSKTMNRRWEYRASLGAAGTGEHVDWGVDVRTQSSATSEWVSNTQGGDFGVGVAQAFGRYHNTFFGMDLGLTVGRAKSVMMYDNISQQLFDNDVRWDGLGWTFKFGNYGVNAAQYVLGAVSQGTVQSATYSKTEASDANPETQSHFGMLYSIQPYAQFKLGEDIMETFAIGWHNWAGTGGSTAPNSGTGFFTNTIHGGTAGTVGNVNPVIMDNSQQWQFLSDTALPNNLRLVAELVRNKKIYYGTRIVASNPATIVDRNAWAVSLAWGKPKKAGDVYLAYTYGEKGLGSVINTFSNGDISADNKSHFLEAKYMAADNWTVGGKAQFHNEKAMLDGNGVAIPSPSSGREQTQQRYELVTTLQI